MNGPAPVHSMRREVSVSALASSTAQARASPAGDPSPWDRRASSIPYQDHPSAALIACARVLLPLPMLPRRSAFAGTRPFMPSV
jgi:hypothetical protein